MALQSNADLHLLKGLLPVSCVFTSLSSFYFCINICIQCHHPFFGRPLTRLPWGLVLNTWLTFLVLSILLTWPIQLTLRYPTKILHPFISHHSPVHISTSSQRPLFHYAKIICITEELCSSVSYLKNTCLRTLQYTLYSSHRALVVAVLCTIRLN